MAPHVDQFRAAIHGAGMQPPAMDIGEHHRARDDALADGC